MLGTVGWVRRHQQWVTAIGGVMLIVVGLLLVTGWWDVMVDWIRDLVLPRLRGGRLMRPRPMTDAADRAGQPLRAAARCVRVELARWAWRQLTSMRTALILLFLLALAAIPGSVVPQEAVDSLRASQWRDQHPQLTPIYEKLGLFSVYDSVWFSAIYILLMVSLVGCFVPRMRVYWRGVRARPPEARATCPGCRSTARFETDEDPEALLERAPACCGQALPGLGKPTDRRARPRCRARLPARGRQPALPPLGAGRAGRASRSAGCGASRAA